MRPIEGALELTAVVVGITLVIVGWANYYATLSTSCNSISCPNLYDYRYRVVFYIGIIATIVGSAGLSWNLMSHMGGRPGTDKEPIQH